MNQRTLPRPKFKSTDTSSDLVLRRTPTPPEPPTPVLEPQPIPVPQTRPQVPEPPAPSPAPQPVVVPMAVEPVSPRRFTISAHQEDLRPVRTRVLVAITTTILWAAMFVSFPTFLASLATAITASPRDWPAAFVMLALSLVLWRLIRFPLARARAGHDDSAGAAVRVTLLDPVSRWPYFVTLPLLVACVLALMSTLFGRSGSLTSVLSQAALRGAMLLICIAVGTLLAWALVKQKS
ncbi:hypothetical protein JOD54_004570 [Actinokineospora baliensis]|uniref:hypothetical protein n=1 Tax=Actinokineospora baliensis TaxID=547056 RepID=UPI00195B0391|nr:hypothetical protein [Actinokineospora baliensis]MBM7774366.1 hypothetical protein [Actinokineospora baliensis]